MARYAYVDHEEKLVIFWTPKAGATLLTKWFFEIFSQRKTAHSDHLKSDTHAWLAINGHVMGYTQAYAMVSVAGYESITIVRHPVARSISAYLNKFVIHYDTPLDNFDSLEYFAKHLYLKAKSCTPTQAKQKYTGITFLKFLKTISALQDQEDTRVNSHWNTQQPPLFEEVGHTYDHVFYMEDLEPANRWLNDRYNIELDFPSINVTPYSAGDYVDCTKKQSTALATQKHLLRKENFINDEAMSLLKKIYKIDFDTFGYNPADLSYIPNNQ